MPAIEDHPVAVQAAQVQAVGGDADRLGVDAAVDHDPVAPRAALTAAWIDVKWE